MHSVRQPREMRLHRSPASHLRRRSSHDQSTGHRRNRDERIVATSSSPRVDVRREGDDKHSPSSPSLDTVPQARIPPRYPRRSGRSARWSKSRRCSCRKRMQFLIGDHAETRNPCDVSERRGYPCMTAMNPGARRTRSGSRGGSTGGADDSVRPRSASWVECVCLGRRTFESASFRAYRAGSTALSSRSPRRRQLLRPISEAGSAVGGVPS